MAIIVFKITDEEGLDAHVRIWNAAGDYYHWTTKTFKAWDLADQPYLMMSELAVVGVGKAQYIASVQGDDLNSSSDTMYLSWAVFDNGTPDQGENPISFVYEIPITAGREGAWSTPGDAMALTGSALSFLGGRSIETVNPVGAGGRVDLVIGDDYSSEDGRHLRWIVTGAHASLATAEIILAVKQSSGAAIEFVGGVSTIDADQGKYLISVNLDNVDTSDLLAGWADYQLVAVIDGRRNTQLFGRTQQTPRLV